HPAVLGLEVAQVVEGETDSLEQVAVLVLFPCGQRADGDRGELLRQILDDLAGTIAVSLLGGDVHVMAARRQFPDRRGEVPVVAEVKQAEQDLHCAGGMSGRGCGSGGATSSSGASRAALWSR